MGPRLYMLAIALVCLALERSHGYVLRDRSWDSDNTLADALRVIDREKRRLLEDEDRGRDRPMERQGYWNAPSSEEEVEEAEREYLSNLFAAPDSESEFLKESPPSVYKIPGKEVSNEVLEPQYQPETKREEVNKEELQDIFLPEHKRNSDKTKKEIDDPSQLEENNVPFDEGEVKHLLDTIEDTETEVLSKNNGVEDVKEDKDEDEKEEVSDEELEDILGPGGEEQVKHVVHALKQEEDEEQEEDEPVTMEDEQGAKAEWPVEMNKEWLVNQYMEGQPTQARTIKKKRSGISANVPTSVDLSDENEEEDENIDLAFLKEYLSLEDEENSNLALALNQATKAQISSQPDQYIPEEVGYLQKAIRDEEEIQRLRGLIQEASDPREIEEESPEQFYYAREPALGRVEEKRAPPVDLDEEEEAVQTATMEEAEDEFVRKLLAEKLKEYLIKLATAEYKEERPSKLDGEDRTWSNSPLPSEEEEMADEDLQLNPFLRELLQKYRIGGYEKRDQLLEAEEGSFGPFGRGGDEDETENALVPIQELYEDEICPAVSGTTNNCAAARAMGLSLDEEAMNLCNRHQTCYSCGGVHGLAADDCDSGYLKEADILCGDSEDCKDEAAALYVIMLQEHGYVPARETNNMCQAQCTFNYIVGAGVE